MVSPEQALRAYVPGISINRGWACCPFHGEKIASMKISQNHVYCYGCHFLGDAVAVTSRLYGLSAYHAIEKLNEDFRLGLPIGRPVTLREGMELRDRVKEAEAKALADKEARALYMRRFEAKLDLEERLFALQDYVLPVCLPPKSPDDPWPGEALWAWTKWEIQKIKYRLDYEDYEV